MGRARATLIVGLVAIPGVAVADPEVHAPDRHVDEILSRLENRSNGLRDIRCSVRFVEDDQINLAQRTKQGRLSFLMTEPNPHFLIHFDKTEADGVVGKQEWYLFDGRWLYQGLERIKQVTKQELAREGEALDLFDLERAPFPLPFGQKKETILRNFEVSVIAPAAGDPVDSDHLVCLPKPGTKLAKKYTKMELFVLRGVDLPGRIVVTKNQGMETNTADFPDLSSKSINTGVSDQDLAKPNQWQKEAYTEVIETLVPKD